jgi:hypothetical protein
MPSFSIKIVKGPTPGQPAAFVADTPGAMPGAPILLRPGDFVSWNNMTSDTHWPWPTDSKFNPLPDSEVSESSNIYLSGPIPAGGSSDISYVVSQSQKTIFYCCKLHPEIRGTLLVES